ncbi:MAG TPA: response regulator transcription factor [Azospirillum sp.]|nr:response regulator transcription factor [Azospirillum sp.]
MGDVNVFLIDGNKLFREGMKRLFDNSPFNVVGEAGSLCEGASALDVAVERPDLLLVDLANADEIEPLRSLRAAHPQTRIVVLTGALCTRQLSGALSAGADGYLMKDIACEALMQSLRLVMMGEKVFPTHLAALLVSSRVEDIVDTPTRRKGLSQRETQILHCLLNGNSNKMIAIHLNITEATVKVHLKSLLRKINASNRTQAAIWAMNNGIGDQSLGVGARVN